MAIGDTLKRVQLEGELQGARMEMARLRTLLSSALCARCGETLGEEEIVQSDDGERTLHKSCNEQEKSDG